MHLRSKPEIETLENLLEEKRNVIAAEIKLHEKLIENARFKTDAILTRDMEKLEELTRWDEAVLEEVATWEDRLEKIVKALAVWFRIDFTSLTSSHLFKLLAEEPKEISSLIPEMQEEHEELHRSVITLKELNEKNTLLLRRSLSVINYSLDVILGKSPKSLGYDQKGRRNKEDKKSFFDTQV